MYVDVLFVRIEPKSRRMDAVHFLKMNAVHIFKEVRVIEPSSRVCRCPLPPPPHSLSCVAGAVAVVVAWDQ